MYTLEKLPKEIDAYAVSSKSLCAEIISTIGLEPEPVTLSAGSALSSLPDYVTKLFFISDGTLKLNQGDKLLYHLETGDIIGPEFMLESVQSDLYAEFAVKLHAYDLESFYEQLSKNPSCAKLWTEYCGNLLAWNSGLLRCLSKDEAVFSPSIMIFQQGDVMVEEGAKGDQVYTLMEGKADVFVAGVKVGELLEEEMFGAVSLLTDRPILASVVAATDCMVVQLSKDEFMNLVQTRPDTIFKLASDLSRAIVSLNEKMIESENPSDA